jgi:hypothetical protein
VSPQRWARAAIVACARTTDGISALAIVKGGTTIAIAFGLSTAVAERHASGCVHFAARPLESSHPKDTRWIATSEAFTVWAENPDTRSGYGVPAGIEDGSTENTARRGAGLVGCNTGRLSEKISEVEIGKRNGRPQCRCAIRRAKVSAERLIRPMAATRCTACPCTGP